MKELISVIVPIYNVDGYLKRCLNSILGQTYTNLELILIDDGSSDQSPSICDDYAKNYSCIKVIHQSNHGVAYSRNAGLDLAQGDYILFVDSDDYIAPNMVELLLHVLKTTKSDISVSGYQRVTDTIDCSEVTTSIQNICVFTGVDCIKNLYNDLYETTVVLWNKLMKRHLFSGLRFIENVEHEDEFIIHHLLNRAASVAYFDTKLYYYQQRQNSIMGRNHNLKGIDKIAALEDRIDFAKENNYEEILYLTELNYMYQLVHKYYSLKLYNKNVDEYLTLLSEKFKLVFKTKKSLSQLHHKYSQKGDRYHYIYSLLHIHFFILKIPIFT